MSGIDIFWAVLGIGSAALSLAVYITFVVVAAVQIIRARITELSKLAWIVAVLAFPAFGAIAWFAFGYRTTEIERYISRVGLPGASR